ncbi:MAG: Crp/Fnr family transcriptional regulator [Caulobacteraceae bacterium]|nr:Crp/Fnr family transcriptional regulator [Caulobacter sp.]
MLDRASAAACATAPSPLAERLGAYASLSEAEQAALEQLQGDPLRLEKDAELCREGEPSTTLFVLVSGAVLASHLLPEGARQILRIHHPGDLMNASCLGWARTAASLDAALPSVVRPVEREAFGALFRTQPRLAALCHGVSVADSVSLCDRLASIGRTSAMARAALLLLELHARQHVGEAEPAPTLSLFLSQADIADATGMTKVHVNRVLRAMSEAGLIARQRREVRLLDRQKLIDMCGYVDRLTHVSIDWLP